MSSTAEATSGRTSTSSASAASAPAPPVIASPLSDEAPHARRVIERTRLSYAPELDASERQQDLVRQTQRALELMGLESLTALRAETIATLKRAMQPLSWQALAALKTAEGDACAVRLTIRVWVPADARRVAVFDGDQPQWVLEPTANLPQPAGHLWFSEKLADVNAKRRYQPRTLSFETYARHAPFAWLLFEHVFREGLYDVERRAPIVVVRSGEDCCSADRTSGPITAESISFHHKYGPDFGFDILRGRYASYGDLVKGCHVPRSNHRLGCAMDINNFAFYLSKDGATNPATASVRHADRARIHALDARNLPGWLYEAAKAMGYRVPADWLYGGARHDWNHIDVGR